jgi:hypothetical protein
VLYFIKKQNTYIADIMAYLSSDWIKNVCEILQKHINIPVEPLPHLNTFFKLVNVMLANTLKNIVYNSLHKLAAFFQRFSHNSTLHQSPILQLSVMDEAGKFVLSDDFKKILTD